MLDSSTDDPLPPEILSPLPDVQVPIPVVDAVGIRTMPSETRSNLMAGDLVEINRARVNGRAWMSQVASVKRVLARGTRAELLSDPTRSEQHIWVRLRLLDDPAGESCFVATRYLTLVHARATVPLTIQRTAVERARGGAPYLAGDLIFTNVKVNLRVAPGASQRILRELPPNTVGTVLAGHQRIGDTDWLPIELSGTHGWVATKHTRLFARSEKWIEVNLACQTLIAWNDRVEDRRLTISSGKPGFRTPDGTFSITRKVPARRTVATVNGEHWDIPGVPWVLVFRSGGYYIHGVYWHNDFGSPVSHGCVTLSVPDAEWLYDWTPVGAPVWIQS